MEIQDNTMSTATSSSSLNFTGTTSHFNEDICEKVLPFKISSLIFTFLAVLFLIYVIAALSYYGFKKKLMIGCGDTSWSSRNQATSIVNSVTLSCAVFVLIYIGVEIPLVAAPAKHFCGVYHRVKIVSFALVISTSYFALWYRVFSMFYRNQVMRKNMSNVIKVVTFLPLILLIFTVVSNAFVFLSAPAYKNMDCGCKAVQEKKTNSIKWTILVVSTVAFQGTLLFSFIYPLHLHRKKMLSRGFDHRLIIPVVKRAAIVAVVCVVSDLINSTFAIVYRGETVYLNHIVISLNLLVNLMGVIVSFATWKTKLFPCKTQKRYFVKVKKTEPRTSSSLNTNEQPKTSA